MRSTPVWQRGRKHRARLFQHRDDCFDRAVHCVLQLKGFGAQCHLAARHSRNFHQVIDQSDQLSHLAINDIRGPLRGICIRCFVPRSDCLWRRRWHAHLSAAADYARRERRWIHADRAYRHHLDGNLSPERWRYTYACVDQYEPRQAAGRGECRPVSRAGREGQRCGHRRIGFGRAQGSPGFGEDTFALKRLFDAVCIQPMRDHWLERGTRKALRKMRTG